MKTINEIYPEYIKYLSLNNKITTIQMKEFKFKNYILPYFGKYKVNQLNKDLYINFICEIKKCNFSPKFNEHVHCICKNFFSYISQFYGIQNITENIKINNSGYTYVSKQQKGTFTYKEFKKFIKCVDNNIYHALFDVLFYCGLRKGEALALKISDVKKDYLIINKTITKESFNGKRIILTPKSKSSNRIIKLDLFTQIELARLVIYYKKHFNNYNSDFYLFGGDKPISCTTLERKKNEYCKKAGVKRIRIHDFRHSHATLLYNKNIKIKLIQERLGHSDINITLNTYVHTNKNQEKKLINKINLTRF